MIFEPLCRARSIGRLSINTVSDPHGRVTATAEIRTEPLLSDDLALAIAVGVRLALGTAPAALAAHLMVIALMITATRSYSRTQTKDSTVVMAAETSAVVFSAGPSSVGGGISTAALTT